MVWNSGGQFSEGLAPVSRNKSYGYVDPSGRVAIDLKFEAAYPFRKGVGEVKKNGKYGLINSTVRSRLL